MSTALKRSTSFCNAAVRNEFKTPSAIFTTPHLRIFSGSPPATADAAETGTLLCVITEASYAALTFGTATAGVLAKSSNTWSGVAGDTDSNTGSSAATKITSGTATAGYWRLCNKADAGGADAGGTSTATPRLQGVIAASGETLVLSSTTITFGATTTVSSAAFSKTPT